MFRIARAPPVVGLALAAGAGVTLNHLDVSFAWTLLSLLSLLRPTSSSPGPDKTRLALVLAFLAGGLMAQQWAVRNASDCRLQLREGQPLSVHGSLLGGVEEGRGRLGGTRGMPVGCTVPLRFVLTSRAEKGLPDRGAEPGARVSLVGEWRRGRVGPRDDPLWAGYLRVEKLEVEGGEEKAHLGVARWRGWVHHRLEELFPKEKSLVEALVLARKEGLSPETREAFARAGTAHLLAISGFHVGVVGGLLLLVGGWAGLSHPFRFLLGSLGIWAYVLFIGLPDAACRAALILTLLALGRFLRRPVAPLGALATAFLFFLLLDPGALLRPGFQLSFSGAFGLVAWGGSLTRWLEGISVLRRRRILVSGLSAGVAATLATLPLVAWHFGRVSLVGIPLTLLVAPLVTLAIPGIFLSFLLSLLFPPAGAFLAQGVEGVLGIFTWLIHGVASLSFASAWVSRPGVVAGTLGVFLGLLWHRYRPGKGEGGRGKGIRLAVGVLSGVILWPLAERVVNRGILEVVMMDVGQGDAIALRSPAGRWILVDAGPRTQTFDAGARRVVPYLRRRGVGEVALMVLTHPDMDHVGGAGSVLEGISVGRVLDPGHVVGTDVFLRALEGAEEERVPWSVARAGDSIHVDGVALRVLWPPAEGGPSGSNESSVVLEVRFGHFSLLLTGDAPTEVEEAVLPHILSEEIQVLKVGHHGSSTSTSPELLERISPSLALISVGRRNRYGHPDASVLGRLESPGTRLFRTDEDGTVILRARRDGTFTVRRLTED